MLAMLTAFAVSPLVHWIVAGAALAGFAALLVNIQDGPLASDPADEYGDL
jgi:hypothetical protein